MGKQRRNKEENKEEGEITWKNTRKQERQNV